LQQSEWWPAPLHRQTLRGAVGSTTVCLLGLHCLSTFLVVLGIESRTLYMLGKQFTTELHPQLHPKTPLSFLAHQSYFLHTFSMELVPKTVPYNFLAFILPSSYPFSGEPMRIEVVKILHSQMCLFRGFMTNICIYSYLCIKI
jgi:hypothetical protein